MYRWVRAGLLALGAVVLVVFFWLQASSESAPGWLTIFGVVVGGVLIWIDIRERRNKRLEAASDK